MVKDEWDSYCPTTSGLPAISWKLEAMMKSALFMASRSAVNWAEKWYLSSLSRLHRYKGCICAEVSTSRGHSGR